MTPPPSPGRFRRTCSATVALVLAALTLLVTAPGASAAPGLAVTSTSTTLALTSRSTPLTGVTVSGLDDATDIQVTVSTDRGTLAMTPVPGLTLAFGNSWSGGASITVTGRQPDLSTGLASLSLSPGATSGVTATVDVAAQVATPGYVYAAPNQHFYEYVPAAGISATAARTAAKSRTFQGQSGYLATMPSSALNDLVSSRIQGATNVWFGARAIDTPTQNPARTWIWGDGPLANQVVSTCTNATGPCAFTTPNSYSSWAPGEPNNSGSGEYVAVTNWGGTIGRWNDLAPVSSAIAGYIVEYGDLPVGSTTAGVVARASARVSVESVPGAPTGVVATRGDTTADVTFTAPASTGGSPVLDYVVTTSPGGAETVCTTIPCTVSGLTNGTATTFTVRARNVHGRGPASTPSAPVTPAGVPGSPTDLSVESGAGSATVRFTAPTETGGSPVTGYRISVEPSGRVVTCAASPCVVPGLTNGDEYGLSVQAVNAVGASAPVSAGRVTPLAAPAAPGGVTASRGDGSATLTFDAPDDDGGTPVTGYRVTVSPGGATVSCPASPCAVDSLENGSAYTFTVAALNAVGLSAESAPAGPVVPATVPGGPSALQVERGDSSAALSFGAPEDGGSPITSYEVSLDGGDTWVALETTGTDPLRVTLTGLTNGRDYDLRVRAVNEVGPGVGRSGRGDGGGGADAPTGVGATRGDGQATVSWTTPAANGSAITGYTVVVSPGGRSVDCPSSPCVVDGLENGSGYTFRVVATNDVGDSDPSDASDAVTPAAVPGRPTLRSVSSTAGALVLRLDPPAGNGAVVVGYQVSLDGGRTWAPLTTAPVGDGLTATVTGLTNGTSYPVAVRAVNAVGNGPRSEVVEATPATTPGAVRSLEVTVEGGKPRVSWRAPASDGGSPVTGYVVTSAPGGQTCTTRTTRCTFDDLPTGVEYRFTVVAVNLDATRAGTGTGPARTSAAVAVTAAPSAPRALAVTAGDRKLALTFTAPADDGGTPVTGYQLSLDGGKTWTTARTTGRAPLRVTVAPVLNGKKFTVRVRARNAAGTGPATSAVKVATVQWFKDPVTEAARKKQVAVPKKPASYRGPLRTTRASARSGHDRVAVPGTSLDGRQLQPGQAVELLNLFSFDGTKISASGRAQVKSVATSLSYVKAVTCEGYADYGGVVSREKKLSATRAAAVCDLLGQYAGQVTSRQEKAYGSSRPVLVGGTPADRSANRRVVVVVRK